MTSIAGKQFTPFVMTWGQRKELKRALALAWAKTERLGQDLETAPNPVAYATMVGDLAVANEGAREALLLFAYKEQGLDQALLDSCTKPSEIFAAVAEFLEANLDPDAEATAKKASELLRGVAN